MRGSTLNKILDALAAQATPGTTTGELDGFAGEMCRLYGVRPAFRGYRPPNFGGDGGFPANICTSLNDEVIHGIPGGRVLEAGDVLKIDLGTEEGGVYDDGATTVLVGELDRGMVIGPSAAARALVAATRAALGAGVGAAKAGNTTHDVARAVEGVAKARGFHVVHGYGGHGIGERLHMDPHVPNEIDGSEPRELAAGTRVAVEPMLATNHGFTYVAADGWTVRLRGGGLAAHFEETVEIR